MSCRNFQSLSALEKPRAADFKSYLQMIGTLNPKVRNKQLHVSIMAKGNSLNKHELTDIAHLWLKKMGYAENPYLIYFHNDNPNNHVHIVSVRVCKDRKSVPSRYEKFRGSVTLHELIGFDPVAQAKVDANNALTYGFTSLDHFKILLKNMGYSGYIKDSGLHMVKHHRTLHSVDLNIINDCIKMYHPLAEATTALQQVFEAALRIVSGKPFRHPFFWHLYLRQNFKSDLGNLLSTMGNLDVVYQSSGKNVTGFTLINHNTKRLHDGKEIIDFARMIKPLENPEGLILGDKVIFYDERTFQDQYDQYKLKGKAPDSEKEIRRRGR